MLAFFHNLYRLFSSSFFDSGANTTSISQPGLDLLAKPTKHTVQTSYSFETWSSFSVEMKTDLVMVEILMQELHLSQQQALNQLEINKQNFNKLLKIKDTSTLEVFWKDFFYNLFPNQRHQLSVVLNIKKFIVANSLKNYEEIFIKAKDLFRKKSPPKIFCEEAYLYQIREILNNWLDWGKAQQQELSALACLKVVLAHYQCPFPIDFFSHAFDRDRFPYMRLLHESALLFAQLHHTDMFDRIAKNGTLSINLLEDPYLSMLAEDWHKQKIFDQLFSKEMSNNQDIYFNGLALKHAAGKSFVDLINNEVFEKKAIYKDLDKGQRRQLLKEKFKQIGESIQYEIGSLAHSLASVVNRILYYQYLPSRAPFQSIEELVLVFKEIEEKWLLEKNYPIQPRLLLAYHLAESNNATIEGKNWKEKFKNLLTYLSKESEQLFLKPPKFDRLRAAVQILQGIGMSTEELVKKRYYVIAADNFNLSLTYFGSPLEEFLRLADWDGIVTKQMFYAGRSIEPRKALQNAEDTFNTNLYRDPWVQSKAKNNLNKPMALFNDTEIEQEAKRIAANYLAETENHRAWMRGLETWLSTMPIIGPLYTIEEGIRDKDAVEIITGVFFLSLDAFDLLFGSEATEEMSSLRIERLRHLPVRERMVVDNVDSIFKKMDLPITELSLGESHLPRDVLSLESNSVPDAQQFLAERVRAGEQGIKWNEHDLVYLSDEDRVVPVKSQGGYFREIDWHSGEIASKKHLIFKDRESGNYYGTTAGLKGGGYDELPESELRQRKTVKQTARLVEQATDFKIYDFDAHFKEFFLIEAVPEASTFNAFEFYHRLYKNSSTFRRIFNLHYEYFTVYGDKPIWKILIYKNAISRADFKEKVIHIAADSELSQLYYVGNSNFEASKVEQIYLHELLHALTGQSDPEKVVSMYHRGPIVYLTDKILSEAGYLFKSRIMYKRLTGIHEIKNKKYEWSQLREEMISLVTQENSYLDKLIAERVPLSEYNNVFGEELATRYTIQETKATLEEINELAEPLTTFGERYNQFFWADNSEMYSKLKVFYEELYIASETFHKLFNHWTVHKSQNKWPWKFEIDNPTALVELPKNKQVHCINELTQKIYIFEDGTHYLSDQGVIPVERQRQLLHEMVQLLTELEDLPADLALKNRGAVVQLTDSIFSEAKVNMPKQLASVLVFPNDLAKQQFLRGYQLELSRAALVEDQFIFTQKHKPISCFPRCLKKRSLSRRKLELSKKNKHSFLFTRQEENIQEVKKVIKASLEQSSSFQSLQEPDRAKFYLNAKKEAASLFVEQKFLNASSNYSFINEYTFNTPTINLN